ncbi:hypothetical protein MT349_03875 [Rathayibacter caricis]|uniref:O-antigen ligase family protein n=1 Tax=Rathayibacter caricis TaxID=110936 RepID=UPI001FB4104D|nr:O-antigen ligase family protein [Rathayibacter caricis]MCJ1694909.1 hypothetical protein [Rathayibacter caricis]
MLVLVAVVFLLPSVFAPGSLSTPSALLASAGVVAAMIRRSASAGASVPPPLWPVCLTLVHVAFLAVITWGGGSAVSASLVVVCALSLVTVVAAQRITASDLMVLGVGLLVLGGLELLVSVLELTGLMAPTWGIAEGDIVGVRLNPFLPEEVPRVQGTVGHPTLLAVLFLVCVIVVLQMTRDRRLAVRLLSLSPFLAGIVLTGTRSVVIVTAAVLLWRLLADPRSVSRLTAALVLGGAASVVAVLFGPGISAYFTGIARETTESGSFSHRAAGLDAIGPLLDRDPLAVLFGSGHDTAPLFAGGLLQQDGFNVIDNQIVTTLATTGVVGLLVLTVTALLAALQGDRLSRTLLLGCLLMFLAVDFIHVLTDSLVVFYASIGLSANPSRRPTDGLGPRRVSSGGHSRGGAEIRRAVRRSTRVPAEGPLVRSGRHSL